MKKVVIVGASFAGLRAYAYLKKNANIDITLIDRHPVATYIPSLYLALNHSRYLSTIQIFLKDHYEDFVRANVISVDSKAVNTSQGSFPFDYIIDASGSYTNFFENDAVKEATYPAKTPNDIIAINKNMRKANHIVVVGGGLTGVEYASMLVGKKHVSIVTATSRLLPALPAKASRLAEKYFHQHKATVYLNARVISANEHAVQLSDGRFIKADMVLWCAGVKRQSCIVSDEIANLPNVFLAGDVRKSKQIPTAHNAMICGEAIAKSIVAKINGENIPIHLHNWETLAVALGPTYGLFIIRGKTVIASPLVGMAKWFIERRIIFEWKKKLLLPI